jgi:hypothetical protein
MSSHFIGKYIPCFPLSDESFKSCAILWENVAVNKTNDLTFRTLVHNRQRKIVNATIAQSRFDMGELKQKGKFK